MASKALFFAFALTLIHGGILLAAKINSAALASSLGLCLDVLGGFLIVSNIVEWVAPRVARVVATPDQKTFRGREVQDYTDMVCGVSLLILGALLQLIGLMLVEWPRPEIPIHRHLFQPESLR